MSAQLRALLILAIALVRSLLGRLAGKRTGLPVFLENYREDRLPPVDADERDRMPAFSGCVACGRCDRGEGARIAASRGEYPGLMRVVLASSRSMPDYDAAARAIAHVPDEVLDEKEARCPTAVPFRQLFRFIRAKAAASAPG
ncbi:MAG: hypothetical protein IT374_02885 [Polyangiaceae bacterium]|nr:hypothetical protein [Polyangiaceae bacterium]